MDGDLASKPAVVVLLNASEGFEPLCVEVTVRYAGPAVKVGLDFEGDGVVDKYWSAGRGGGEVVVTHTYRAGYYEPTAYLYTEHGVLENHTDLAVYANEAGAEPAAETSDVELPDFANPSRRTSAA